MELKLTEVDNEFSTYPAALSVELRQLNNKLAIKEEENRWDLITVTNVAVFLTVPLITQQVNVVSIFNQVINTLVQLTLAQ